MGYEQMSSSFDCLCGNGHIVAQWEEHDTYPSPNRHYTWSFQCPACAAEYEFYTYILGPYIVRKVDVKKHRAIVKNASIASGKLHQAAKKYEQQWVAYVLSLASKAAMHRITSSNVDMPDF